MNVNVDYYIHDILEKEVKPAFSRMQTSTELTLTKLFSRNREGMFQRDGARAHTSKATVAWLDANIKHYIPVQDWPPNSPDLSPIENVWSIMATARRLCRLPTASLSHQSLQALKHRLRKHRNRFLCQHFTSLIGSMPNRLKAAIKTVEIPFHTNSEHGQRHRLTLTFIGPLLCNFKGGLI